MQEPAGRATEPRFERIAYHVVSTGSETWQSFNFTTLTGVVQFGGWDPALQQRARAHGVRTFSEFGWACLPSQPCTWIANRTEAALRAQAAVDLANQRGADGINIDIEGAGAPSCTAPDLEYFVREVSRRFAGGTTGTIGTNDANDTNNTVVRVILNVNAFPDAVSPRAGQAYNFTALSAIATGAGVHLAIMLYDMAWWNAGVPHVATANSPIESATSTLQRLVTPGSPQHVPAERLLAVWPWYGYSYACNESTPLLSPCKNALPYCCGPATAAKQVSFADALRAQHSPGATAVQRSGTSTNVTGSPWFDMVDANGTRHQVHFDDEQSLRAKYAVASSLGLRGVAVWTANADYLQPLLPDHTADQRVLFATLQEDS